MSRILDIIIPTWNNPQYFDPCVNTIIKTGILNDAARLIVVNNGDQKIAETYSRINNMVVLKPNKNLGWEGGLKYGLQHSDAPFVCFQNDDTHIPIAQANFYMKLLHWFSDDNVAAVGPSTTIASGWHSTFNPYSPLIPTEVSYLIFFCVMIRRAHLDLIGGIDDTLPGGDDFDMSIRFRKAGKKLLINPSAFIIHHAFKTGERVNGKSDKVGGWNSQDMTDRTNQALIRKHGFKTWLSTVRGLVYDHPEGVVPGDTEGEFVKAYVGSSENVLELGCGPRKTVDRAIGMDRVPYGDLIPGTNLQKSVADVIGNVENPLPFDESSFDAVIGRHILEHCIDSVKALKNWYRVLKHGGKLVIAVPDERVTQGIPANPEHAHAFSPESLKSLMEVVGFKEIENRSSGNGVSFVGVYEKNGTS